jgi:hypothetical protein
MKHIHRQGQWSLRSSRLRGEGNAAVLQAAAECLLADHIRLLVHAACVARRGAAQATLGDWRDVKPGAKQTRN